MRLLNRVLCLIALCVAMPAGDARGEPVQVPGVPANLEVDPILRPTVIWLLDRSPTFQRQCLRLGAARGVSVRLFLQPSRPGGDADGLTQVRRDAASRLVRTEIGVMLMSSPHKQMELIAHELEHVIEQLDGIDLASLERRGVSGVAVVGSQHFETARAVAIGRQVRREVETYRQQLPDASGHPADHHTLSVSADGRFVAFTSSARLSPPDTNDLQDVYVLDLARSIVTLETAPAAGMTSNGDSMHPS